MVSKRTLGVCCAALAGAVVGYLVVRRRTSRIVDDDELFASAPPLETRAPPPAPSPQKTQEPADALTVTKHSHREVPVITDAERDVAMQHIATLCKHFHGERELQEQIQMEQGGEAQADQKRENKSNPHFWLVTFCAIHKEVYFTDKHSRVYCGKNCVFNPTNSLMFSDSRVPLHPYASQHMAVQVNGNTTRMPPPLLRYKQIPFCTPLLVPASFGAEFQVVNIEVIWTCELWGWI